VIVWLPAVNVEMVNVACPLLRVTGLGVEPVKAVPGQVAPSMKVTLPVGVPLALVTVAVNVTDCPNVDGLGDDITAVLVAGLVTVSAAAVIVLLLA